MKMRFYSIIAKIFLFLGIFFIILESIYGYIFHVWNDLFLKLTMPEATIFITKLGETILFAYLGLSSILISISAGIIASKQD